MSNKVFIEFEERYKALKKKIKNKEDNVGMVFIVDEKGYMDISNMRADSVLEVISDLGKEVMMRTGIGTGETN